MLQQEVAKAAAATCEWCGMEEAACEDRRERYFCPVAESTWAQEEHEERQRAALERQDSYAEEGF